MFSFVCATSLSLLHLAFMSFCLYLSSGDEDYLFASQHSISLVKSESFSASIGPLLLIQIISPFSILWFLTTPPPIPQYHPNGREPIPGVHPSSLCELVNAAYVLLCHSIREKIAFVLRGMICLRPCCSSSHSWNTSPLIASVFTVRPIVLALQCFQ